MLGINVCLLESLDEHTKPLPSSLHELIEMLVSKGCSI